MSTNNKIANKDIDPPIKNEIEKNVNMIPQNLALYQVLVNYKCEVVINAAPIPMTNYPTITNHQDCSIKIRKFAPKKKSKSAKPILLNKPCQLISNPAKFAPVIFPKINPLLDIKIYVKLI